MRIIREAKPTDITDIMQVMEAAKSIMRRSGNMHQWGDGYRRRLSSSAIWKSTAALSLRTKDVLSAILHSSLPLSLPTQRFMMVSGQMIPFPIMSYIV